MCLKQTKSIEKQTFREMCHIGILRIPREPPLIPASQIWQSVVTLASHSHIMYLYRIHMPCAEHPFDSAACPMWPGSWAAHGSRTEAHLLQAAVIFSQDAHCSLFHYPELYFSTQPVSLKVGRLEDLGQNVQCEREHCSNVSFCKFCPSCRASC